MNAEGEVVPTPNLLFVLSKNRLLLSCASIPAVPAKKIDPAVALVIVSPMVTGLTLQFVSPGEQVVGSSVSPA